MFPLLSGLLSGGASLLGSIFSSQTSASNTQEQLAAQEQMQSQTEQFNASQADLNRQFQEQMSNTAYQRAATDMKAAGLNPILAAGANESTPSGAVASVGTPSVPMPQKTSPLAGLGDAVSKTVSTAIQAKTFEKMTDEIANLRADTARAAAGADLEKAQTATEGERRNLVGNEALDTGFRATVSQLGASNARSVLGMPAWLRDNVVRAGFLGGKVGEALDPVLGLVGSARGVARQLSDNTFRNRYYFGE